MRAILVVLGGLAVGACTSFETQPPPVWPYPERPVASPSGSEPARAPSRREEPSSRGEPEASETVQRSGSNSAVVSLVNQARQESRQGQLERAAATLERALGIAPQDPLPWIELAFVRFEQGNLVQAESLARRSLSFVGQRRDIAEAAWLLIADIKGMQGDSAAEMDARRRAKAI